MLWHKSQGAGGAGGAGGGTPLGEDLSSAFYPVSEFVNEDGFSNTPASFSVSEIQSSYSGTGRLLLVHKAASGEQSTSSFYYDAPVACIQVLNSLGTTVTQQWWFGASNNAVGWETQTVEYNWGAADGLTVTPSQVTGSFIAITNGAIPDRFSLSTGTGSSSTGTLGGIPEPSGPMSLGEKTTTQSGSTYYIYREMSGGVLNYSAICRSPSRTWANGERIRIAYNIGQRNNNTTGSYYDPDDTFFFGIV